MPFGRGEFWRRPQVYTNELRARRTVPANAMRIDADGGASAIDLPEDNAQLRAVLRGILGGFPERAFYHRLSDSVACRSIASWLSASGETWSGLLLVQV